MEWSRVKSILITLLLVTNLMLGFNLVSQLSAGAGSEKEDIAAALALLRSPGVQIDEGLLSSIPKQADILTSPRDPVWEAQIATAILGQVEHEEAGGGVSIYRSQKGDITFRSGGLFDMMLTDETDAATLAQQLLNNVIPRGFSGQVQGSDGRPQLTLTYRETPVSGVEIVCRDTLNGCVASGRWLFFQNMQKFGESASVSQMLVQLYRVFN